MTESKNDSPEHTMPDEVKAIAKAFAETARNLGLHNASGRFRPKNSIWGAEVSWNWEQGRHGEDCNQIQMTSTFFIHERIKP